MEQSDRANPSMCSNTNKKNKILRLFKTRSIVLGIFCFFILGSLSSNPAMSSAPVPTKAVVIIPVTNNSITVNLINERAIINWDTFKLTPGNQLLLIPSNASHVILNHVNFHKDRPRIDSVITANGKDTFVNDTGFFLLKAQGLSQQISTTADINHADFFTGRFIFNDAMRII